MRELAWSTTRGQTRPVSWTTVQHSPERSPNFTFIVRVFFPLAMASVRTIAGNVPLCQVTDFTSGRRGNRGSAWRVASTGLAAFTGKAG